MRRVFRGIADALFPRKCVRCGTEGKEVCDLCFSLAMAEEWGGLCPACKKPSLLGTRCVSCNGALDGLVFCAPYADAVVRGLLQRWKFEAIRTTIEPSLQRLMERVPFAQLFSGTDWTITSVPLHPRRERERGFNQARWIAERVGELTQFPAGDFLQRLRNTLPQSQRPEAERKRDDLARVFQARPIEGRVILCDDVFTSGATMEAAAHALKSAGASIVWGVVLAHG